MLKVGIVCKFRLNSKKTSLVRKLYEFFSNLNMVTKKESPKFYLKISFSGDPVQRLQAEFSSKMLNFGSNFDSKSYLLHFFIIFLKILHFSKKTILFQNN